MKRFAAKLLLLLAIGVRATLAAAQDFAFEPPTEPTDPTLPAALRDLAERVVPAYREEDADRYLSNLAALQMALDDPAAAHATRRTLQERLQSERGAPPTGRTVVYDIYTQARAIEATESVPFESAYAQAFRETLSGVDDLAAYELEDWFLSPTEPLRETLQRALDKLHGKSSAELEDALDLVRAWFAFEAYRSIADIVPPLLAEDKERRFIIEEVAISVSRNSTVAATLVRPRAATAVRALPTLLEFTLDRSSRDPVEAAAHGYASLLAFSRISGPPQFRPRSPFESEGDDARAVIDWITEQSWSNGRIAMQGSGYGGFVAWAAAKRRPTALLAIATSDPIAPGIDVPMAGRIAHNSAYRWVYEMLAPPADEVANDDARWRALDEDWYGSGRLYRDFPTLPGRARAVFRSWLNHPSYDRFWQKWLPFGAEFAQIEIPVLTVTGYYSPRQSAALYYFAEHRRHNPNANHALLIGPFDEQSIQHGASSSIRGLALDPVARIDPNGTRYAWLAHVLEGAERPELLSDNINYEIAGANEWRHEPSLPDLENKPRRLYLEERPGAALHALVAEKPSAPMSYTMTLDLRDRTDAEWRPAEELILSELQSRDGAALFATQPFAENVDLVGRLRGGLDFTINKYDVDLVLMLYEQRSSGEYVKLFEPAYAFRASYARDRVKRRLLLNGVRQQLPFQSDRLVGRRLEAGSRLVLALGINKRADQQINYGAGGDVSEESIEAAGAPIRIRWHEGSFIEIPSR
jgi:putative CocE/NonD family hydrolase